MRPSAAVLAELTDFQGWRADKSDFELLDYAGCVATPDLLFAFGALFEPDLVLHDGEYYLGSHFSPSTYAAWKAKLNDPTAIQKVMNHIHVSTLFQSQQVADEVARAAAETIAGLWSLVFRDKGLVAEAHGSNLADAHVTLYRVKPQS